MSYWEEDGNHIWQEFRIFFEFFVKDGIPFDRDNSLRAFLEEIIGSTAPIRAHIHYLLTFVIDEAVFSFPEIEGNERPAQWSEVINPILHAQTLSF